MVAITVWSVHGADGVKALGTGGEKGYISRPQEDGGMGDDLTRIVTVNLADLTGNLGVEGSQLGIVGGEGVGRELTTRNVGDMSGMYSAISSWAKDDTVVLAGATTYQGQTITLQSKYGTIECTNDSADYVLDGQSSRRVIDVQGIASGSLKIRPLSFQNGRVTRAGGGTLISNGDELAIVRVSSLFVFKRQSKLRGKFLSLG